MTNILDVCHADVKESNGQTGGGGVSVYYSHCLQLLCFSYAQGQTFMTSVTEDERNELQIGPLHPIKTATSSSSSSSSSSGSLPAQPLCQWAEVAGHPGLLLALTQSSYSPIIIVVEPHRILVEEIKVVPAKVKVINIH